MHTCLPAHIPVRARARAHTHTHTHMYVHTGSSLSHRLILLCTDLCVLGNISFLVVSSCYSTYLSSLLRTILILSFKGRFFSGMENQVFLPIITRFCLPIKPSRMDIRKHAYIFSDIHRQDDCHSDI